MPAQLPARYIDFHVHLFPEKLRVAIYRWFRENTGWEFYFQKPWEDGVSFLEGLPALERYVCFGYAHKPGIARELNRFYAAIPKISPKALPLGCVHQDDPDVAAIAAEGFDLGLAGFKLHCQVQKVEPGDRRLWPLYEVVRERGGFVLLHAGNGPFSGPCVGFERFLPLMRRFPDLKCVVAHLGAFESDLFLRAALDCEGLYLDTSYTFIANPSNRMDAPVELLEAAHRKVLFATDFPGICHPYEDGVRAIAESGLSPAALDAVFLHNARRFLGLGTEP